MFRGQITVCLAFVFGGVEIASADTVIASVAGLVVDQANTRLPSVRVRLHAGAELASYVTRRGVYNLTASGIDAQTSKLLVRCNERGYDESFIEVELDDPAGGIRRATAPELVLYSNNSTTTTRADAHGRLSNAIRTEKLKVEWKISELAQAQRDLTTKAAGIAASLPEKERENWPRLINESLDREMLNVNPFNRALLLELPRHDEFQKALGEERARLKAAHLDIDQALEQRGAVKVETIDNVLSLPAPAIPNEWLERPAVKGNLPTIAKEYGRGAKRYVFDFDPDGAVADTATLVQGNDLKKRVLLYEGLLRNPNVSPEDRKRIETRIQEIVPQIRRK